jgi:predicted phosphoribosyltransferase
MHIARRTPVADIQRFSNRMQAGRLLAGQLGACAGRADMLALALPRGGVPVGYAMAQALGIALDVLVVRKLGMPRHEEYAMGALGSGGVRVLQPGIPAWMGITKQDVDRVSARELAELERRERVYRGARSPLALHGRSAILVDDGVATGSTMLAAIAVARLLQPHAGAGDPGGARGHRRNAGGARRRAGVPAHPAAVSLCGPVVRRLRPDERPGSAGLAGPGLACTRRNT